MPGTASLSLIGLDAVTTAVAGPSLGLQGQIITRDSGGKADGLYVLPFTAVCTLLPNGASPSATVIIETSPLGAASWTQWGSPLVYDKLVQQTHRRLGKLPTSAVYVRMRVSAINNAKMNGVFDIPGG